MGTVKTVILTKDFAVEIMRAVLRHMEEAVVQEGSPVGFGLGIEINPNVGGFKHSFYNDYNSREVFSLLHKAFEAAPSWPAVEGRAIRGGKFHYRLSKTGKVHVGDFRAIVVGPDDDTAKAIAKAGREKLNQLLVRG